MKLAFWALAAVSICRCVPVTQTAATEGSSDQLRTEDYIYENTIHSVRLFPAGASQQSVLNSSVYDIRQRNMLTLEFDDLVEQAENYYVRLIHCNADWSKSTLTDIEYMQSFNEFLVEDYEYSFNTKTPYVSYRFRLPQVKLPGNYVLAVYRYPNKNDLLLTKRFMAIDNIVQVGLKTGLSSGISERMTNQQLEFTVNYNNYEIINPYQDVKVTLRQNQQWHNAIYNLKPTSIRENLSQLEYVHFNLENNFRGGNEYRYFDIRSVTFTGMNVGRVVEEGGRYHAFLLKDKPRARQAYSAYNDLNGGYIVENLEPGKDLRESEYVNVHFLLEMESVNQDIYISGELTNRAFDNTNKMKYDAELKAYTGSLLLKQGWYNYLYYAPLSENPYLVEGSHYETENQYEVIVYHRAPGSRADMIVGYRNIQSRI